MSGHSPGPWRIEECECSDSGTRWSEWAVTSAAGPICAEIFLEPNARLIAAAPELLKVLQAAVPTIVRPSRDNPTCPCDPCVLMRQVRAAIARAEGRQP